MATEKDPTQPIRHEAANFPDAVEGTSCNQTSFKVGKVAFLYLGPGTKGLGFKAMFKLDASTGAAKKLAAEDPDRFQVGSNRWVTTRFNADEPLSSRIWKRWLKESYEVTCGSGANKKTGKNKVKATKTRTSARKRK